MTPGILTIGIALAACERSREDFPSSPVPTAISCADASQLRQRALDDRQRIGETSSDQKRVSLGARAGFYASLAVIADLKCRITLAEVDEALKPALDAARKAEASPSFYEAVQGWAEAGLTATQVIALLVRALPVPAN